MKPQSCYSDIGLNLLVAVAVTLVVNFSYLLLLLVEQRSDPPHPQHPQEECVTECPNQGRLAISPDGHGYLVYERGDSVYVPMQRIHRMGLAEGDRLVVDVTSARREGGHPVMTQIRMRNGEKFDMSSLYNRPSESLLLVLQLLYYLLMSFIFLSILTSVRRNYSASRFVMRCLWCVAAAVVLYSLAPITEWRTGRILFNFMGGRIFDYMLLLKCSFALVVSILYGRIYVLISQRQAVVVENERLKNENLTTRYNMLMGQINPHFFFNSLNSLAMLVREKQDEKALTYIDQLSYTFRRIIQSGQCMMQTLGEELRFAEAYSYLFKIRYADKLFFDVEVDPQYLSWRIPELTLQPLIDNAVKHNAITRSNPFHVSIRTEGDCLVVSNRKVPKLEAEPSTGIGLDNLRNRWQLITGVDIEVIDTPEQFTVRLPLQKPDTQ